MKNEDLQSNLSDDLYNSMKKRISDYYSNHSIGTVTREVLNQTAELLQHITIIPIENTDFNIFGFGHKKSSSAFKIRFSEQEVNGILDNINKDISCLETNIENDKKSAEDIVKSLKDEISSLQRELKRANEENDKNMNIFLQDMQLTLEFTSENSKLFEIRKNTEDSLGQFGVRVIWEPNNEMFNVYDGNESRVRPCLISKDGRVLLKGYSYNKNTEV